MSEPEANSGLILSHTFGSDDVPETILENIGSTETGEITRLTLKFQDGVTTHQLMKLLSRTNPDQYVKASNGDGVIGIEITTYPNFETSFIYLLLDPNV